MSSPPGASIEWLTVFEVLERTNVPYPEILHLAGTGELTTRRSGATVLYRGDDVDRLAAVRRSALQ